MSIIKVSVFKRKRVIRKWWLIHMFSTCSRLFRPSKFNGPWQIHKDKWKMKWKCRFQIGVNAVKVCILYLTFWLVSVAEVFKGERSLLQMGQSCLHLQCRACSQCSSLEGQACAFGQTACITTSRCLIILLEHGDEEGSYFRITVCSGYLPQP